MRSSRGAPVPDAGGRSDAVRVTVEERVDADTARLFYGVYRDTFGELETLAVARQLLHEEEFLEEMQDARVWKIVAWSPEGEVIGLTTLTRHLQTVPWISPAYFTHHYPEQAARDALFYLGFTLVRRDRRRDSIFAAMLERAVDIVTDVRGVCGWDICMYNDDSLALSQQIERLLHRFSEVEIVPIDRQTYYAGTFGARRS